MIGNIFCFETESNQSKYVTVQKEMNEHTPKIKTTPRPKLKGINKEKKKQLY